MPDRARTSRREPQPWGRFDLAVVRLQRLRTRHFRIADPSIAANSAGICESDRHRWPCHASTLLDGIDQILTLLRDKDGHDLPDGTPFLAGEIRAALTAGLLDKGHLDE